jgi:zinc transporter, ZIP family
MVVSSLWIGLLAAACTCTGLALVRRLPQGPGPRGLLTMGAAGLVLFVLIDVGYQALGTVELVAVSDNLAALVLSGVLLLVGLLFGLVGLAWIESRRGRPGADVPQPLDVAVMLAVGVGLRNFAEGLAVGQSMATSLVGPGGWLVIGLALHSLLYGAAVASPVAGEAMPLSRLVLLAICAAGPSLFGTVVGTTWVGPGLELLVLSVAAGGLIYVLRELLRAPLSELTPIAAMWALALGLLAGLGTEMLVNAGRQRDPMISTIAPLELLAAPAQPRTAEGNSSCHDSHSSPA